MAKQNEQETPDLASIIASSHPNRRWVKYLIAITILLAGIAGFFLLQRGNSSKPNAESTYQTQPLRKGNVSLSITATGNLAPTNEVTVGSEVSGLVVAVHVDSNDQVEKGQELAVIDATRIENELRSNRASLESAKAAVKQAEASLRLNRLALDRHLQLREKSENRIPSQAVIDSAIAEVEIAEATLSARLAAVRQSEAQIEIRETELSKTRIRSPTNGIVLTRSVEPGQTVAASFSAPELFVIAEDLTRMKLEVAIAEADIAKLAEGQRATFSVDAWPDRQFNATVKKVSFGSQITDNVVTYATELDVRNQDKSLRPGMTATADIFVSRSDDVWVVPVQALRFQPPGAPDSTATTGRPQERSFIETMVPRPSRRWGAGNTGAGASRGAPESRGVSKIWILKEGVPASITVHVGLTDGRVTEVSGEELVEGMSIILFQNPKAS
jgi:HlyD family secretion protein